MFSISLAPTFDLHNNRLMPGVRAQQPDRDDVLGELLPAPRLGPRQGGAGGDHRAHHGHPHGLRQQVRQQTIHVNMS